MPQRPSSQSKDEAAPDRDRAGSRRSDADRRRLEFQTVMGPDRPHGRYDFEAASGETRRAFSLDAHLSGLRRRLMSGAVQRTMDAEVRTLDNLKSVLET